jgi:CheY-like chemotaxis protein
MTTADDMPDSSGKQHILVVEDDEGFGATMAKIHGSAGFEVSVAADFRVALQVMEADRPLDLLVTDIVMPGSVNGIALSRMARMRRRDVKILYVTGYSIPGAEKEALGPILRKPFEDTVFVETVRRLLSDSPSAG